MRHLDLRVSISEKTCFRHKSNCAFVFQISPRFSRPIYRWKMRREGRERLHLNLLLVSKAGKKLHYSDTESLRCRFSFKISPRLFAEIQRFQLRQILHRRTRRGRRQKLLHPHPGQFPRRSLHGQKTRLTRFHLKRMTRMPATELAWDRTFSS